MKSTILQLKALVLVIMSLFCVNLVNAQGDFKWELMGPDNVGGAVKAVLYDKADTKGFTMYAGAANGGFLKGLATKHGTSWSRVDFSVGGEPVSLNISCMIQADDNTIYIGTGSKEDTLRGYPVFGKGVYSYKDGVGTLIAGTKPLLGDSEEWKFVNAIQLNGEQLWVATNTGLFYQNGTNWTAATLSDGTELSGNATEVKIINDKVFVYVADKFYTGTLTGSDFTMNEAMSEKIPNPSEKVKYPGPGIMKFAVGNYDRNIVYAMRVYPYVMRPNTKNYNTINYAFYISTDGGNNWNTIIAGNSVAFLPYFGTSDNSNSNPNLCNWTMSTRGDCVFSVLSNPQNLENDGVLAFGYNKLGLGVRYMPGSTTDFTFSWPGALSQGGSMPIVTPYYVHEYVYSLVLNPYKPGEFLVGSAGGVSAGTVTSEANIVDGAIFKTINRGIDVTDFNAISFSSNGSVLGGTLNNGLQYFNKSVNTGKASREFYGAATNSGTYNANSFYMSGMFDNVMFVRGTIEATGAVGFMRTETNGADFAIKPLLYQNVMGEKDSVPNPMMPTTINLWESVNDHQSIDSVDFLTVISYKEGDKVWVESNSQKYPILYTFEKDCPIGETVKVQDIVSSKAFFTWSQDANTFNAYLVRAVDNFKLEPTPLRIGRFTQYPNPHSTSSTDVNLNIGTAKHACLSSNGNSYYVLTSNGVLVRISNLRGVYDAKTSVLKATDMLLKIGMDIDYVQTSYGKYGKDVYSTSMCIDPAKEERILLTFNKPITFTGAEGVSNVFICENTFAENPRYVAVTGLEDKNILSSMFYLDKENGNQSTDKIMIGTTMGLMYANDVNNPIWIDGGGTAVGNVPVTDIKQQLMVREAVNYTSGSPISPKPQTWPPITNSYDLYLSTYGNGVYIMAAPKNLLGVADNNLVDRVANDMNIKVYPNPVINTFQAEVGVNVNILQIKLVDMSGRTIEIKDFDYSTDGEVKINNIGGIKGGIYMVQIIASDRVYTGKIIKK